MTPKPRGRRHARVVPFLAGTALLAVLAVPSSAAAQSTPTGAGKLYYTDGHGKTHSLWADGSHHATVAGLPTGQVGSFNGTGDVLSLSPGGVPGGVEAFFATVTADVPAVKVTDPAGRDIFGLAGSPNGDTSVIATSAGVFRISGGNTVHALWQGSSAGRIAWSSENAVGTVVFDALDVVPGGGIPGGDPDVAFPGGNDLPSGLQTQDGSGTGIWIWSPGMSAPVEIVDDPSAANPSISQDGRIIAFEMESGTSDGVDVYYVDRNEAIPVPHRLGSRSTETDSLPTVSPDGTQVAYFDGATGLLVRSAIGTTPVTATPITTAYDSITGLAWQPTEAVIAGSVSISGTVQVGETLTAVAGTQNYGGEPIEERFVWESCDDLPADGPDPSCSVVKDGSSTYVVQASDVGKRLRAVRVAKNPAGENRAYSQRTAVVPGGSSSNPTPTDSTPPGAPTFTDDVPAPFVDYRYPQFGWTPAEPGGTFECRIVPQLLGDLGVEWAACTSPAKGSTPLTSGEYVFEVRQIDAAHNKGQVARHSFTVDLDEPVPPTLVDVPAKTTTKTSATFAFTNPSNEVVTFECRLDALPTEHADTRIDPGPRWKACTSPHVVEGLAVGEHQMEIRQVDRAGNTSSRAVYTWTVQEAPVVLPPVEEPETPKPVDETPKPVEQAPEPVKETPALVETPKAETPAPAPRVEAPKPEAPAKRPALTAVIGGTKTGAQAPADGGSSAATIQVAKESVGVGCTITGTVLKSCKVDLYATVAVRESRAGSRSVGSRASVRAAKTRQVLVGTGTYEQTGGASKMHVQVELNATGKALLRKTPGGLKVAVRITGRPVSGAPLKATGAARLVSDRAALTVGGFAVNSAELTPAARRALRTFAAFGEASTVRCVGHTDASSDDAGYLRTLGARRAKAVCAFLAQNGVQGTRTLVSKGSGVPVATNATKAGRAQNRRVQVTLVR
jgi:outer membrane protein OmpA-like peptidoglycan-associated protein